MSIAAISRPVPTSARSHALEVCISKIRSNIQLLAERPTTWALAVDGDYAAWKEGFYEIGNWTASFFTGMAVIAFKQTNDRYFLEETTRLQPFYEAKVGEHSGDTMHDIGFLYSLYSIALYKVTGDTKHRDLALKAAQVLADRFIPEGNYIRAWGRMDDQGSDYAGLAIIDCMMNLPLLYWASEETGDPRFKDIALRHSDTTLAHFIREDDSVYHSYRFDSHGAPVGGDNYCGRAVESHWARGATWAIYGFAMGYRYTGDPRYLDASLRLARRFISLLDDEVVPIWDFRLDPEAPFIRDSSAAAIAACAFQELEALNAADETMKAAKNALLDRLCSPDYLDENPAIKGVLKQGEVGDGVGKAKSAYTSWGDYYFMEALARESGTAIDWW
ncbi:MAG TPA: glycoside hydrolase family 88 protein [Luteolibacter sp.]